MPILIFIGPPSAGKDHATDRVVNRNGGHKLQFKDELITNVCDYYNLSPAEYEVMSAQFIKEEPQERLGGKSMRQCMIEISETVVKPRHGNDYYGKALASKLLQLIDVYGAKTNYCISDGGVLNDGEWHELAPLLTVTKHLNIPLYLVQIIRNGCTFKNDSRCYVGDRRNELFSLGQPTDEPIEDSVITPLTSDLPVVTIHNHGSVLAYGHCIQTMIKLIGDKK